MVVSRALPGVGDHAQDHPARRQQPPVPGGDIDLSGDVGAAPLDDVERRAGLVGGEFLGHGMVPFLVGK